MNRSELVDILNRARISEALYDIPGVHDITVEPDAYYFLRPGADAWIVGLREHSRDSLTAHFATEDEACRYLYDRLAELPAPVTGAVAAHGPDREP